MGLFTRAAPPAPPANTVIGPDTLLKGDLVTQHDIELSGRVEGSVECRGTLRLGRSSTLEGRTRCGALHCSGVLKAEAAVEGTATFTADGTFQGTLVAGGLRIERGACLQGSVRRKPGAS